MEQLSLFHILGSAITLLVIIFIGIYTARKVKGVKKLSLFTMLHSN